MAQTNSNKFQNIFPDRKVTKVCDGFRFTEGPVWIPEGYLLFSDIPSNIIYKWNPDLNTVEVFREPSGHSNGLTLDLKGRLLACEHDGRVSITEQSGKVNTFIDSYNGKRLNSPNDIVVKSNGNVYFTDPPFGLNDQTTRKRELSFNGVYCVSPERKITLLNENFTGPNGIAFSQDEKTLYVNDSVDGFIKSFPVKENGLLGEGKLFAELINPDEEGVPDGMKVDIKGNILCTGPGGIWAFDKTGTILGILNVPEVPANLGWGGKDLKTLYITARTGVYRIESGTGGKKIMNQ